MLTARLLCVRCRRPTSACWCAELKPVQTTTRVVFLQHPRESKVAVGTARIAHLGLASSELHEGINFAEHARVSELIAKPGTALLFPGQDAVAPETLECAPETLLVIDGTWPQARKMMALNPALRALPRIGFIPKRPGNYRIRREPAEHCVATVEAVVEVLAVLERDDTRFAQLLRAFESMVDWQIAAAAARTKAPRQRRKPAGPWWESSAMPDLESLWPQLVVIAGEANAHHRGSAVPGMPELVQLAAVRPATGEAFEAFLAPRRPLAPNAAKHLEVSREQLLTGRTVREVLAEWRRFLPPDARLVGWGGHSWGLLEQEGWRPEHPPIDLRLVAAHRLKRRPGAPETAAAAIGSDLEGAPLASGRAGRTLQMIVAFVRKLLEEKRAARPTDFSVADPAEGKPIS